MIDAYYKVLEDFIVVNDDDYYLQNAYSIHVNNISYRLNFDIKQKYTLIHKKQSIFIGLNLFQR